MESSELYSIKQQFILGAYQSLVALPLPSHNSPDYTPTLLYQARAHIALSAPSAALKLLATAPSASHIGVRAASSLARYVAAAADEEEDAREAALEELRDLCVAIEGEDAEGEERDRWLVRVLAGTAFARAGEVEEALESLGAGSNAHSLEAVAVTVQIYLSIHRADLARKEVERAKRWAEDDLLLQHIDATISLATGHDGYADCNSFFTEQLANPSLTSPHLFTARGVTRILLGEVPAAVSDLEEVREKDAESLAALVVAAELSLPKGETSAEQLWSQLVSQYPTFPMVVDVQEKSDLFDELAAKFEVPPLATAAA